MLGLVLFEVSLLPADLLAPALFSDATGIMASVFMPYELYELETHTVKNPSKFTYCIWCSLGFQEHIPLLHLPAISLSPFESFLHMHSLAISQRVG